jgi:hypothetical protein
MVRAKFRCETVVSLTTSATPNPTLGVSVGEKYAERVKLSAVTTGPNEENKSWAKYTPLGSLEMQIDNPGAFEKFERGKEYFLDFTPVPPPTP